MHLVGYECRLHFVDTNNKPEKLLELNPAGTVPVLVASDVICGSNEIIDYLSSQLPEFVIDLEKPAQHWHVFANDILGKGTKDWIFSMRDKSPEQRSDKVLEAAKAAWFDALATMESHISNSGWFLDGPSIADCALIPRIALATHYGLDGLQRYPLVNAWFEGIRQSDLYKATAPAGFC